MKLLEFSFQDETIRGMLQGDAKRLVIMSHGFTGNRIDHHAFAVKEARLIESYGYSVLRFDFLGNGESTGSEESYHPMSEIEQLEYVISQVEKDYDEIILWGFSYGGVISSQVAARNKDKIQHLVLVNPAGNMPEILDQFLSVSKRVNNGYDFAGYYFSDILVESIRGFHTFKDIQKFDKKVFMIESLNDEYVSLASGQTYKEIYGEQMQAYSLEGCDHCFRGIDQTERLFTTVRKIMEEL